MVKAQPQPTPTVSESASAESVKETIDSTLIALALALVFRAFIIEAFIIPTGSMAITLFGLHRSYPCANCGHPFDVQMLQNVSPTDQLVTSENQEGGIFDPNCEFRLSNELAMAARDKGGDKILVFKFPYLGRDPARWDVVVFYNPQWPDENFIKRLIGKPGEYVQIVGGDIYIGTQRDELKIQRKPDKVQQAMWRVAYLNDYLPAESRQKTGNAPRWSPPAGSAWSVSEQVNGERNGRVLAFGGSPGSRLERIDFHPGKLGLAFQDYSSYNKYHQGVLSTVWDLRLEFDVFFSQPGGVVLASMNRRISTAAPERNGRFVARVHQDGLVELFHLSAGDDVADVLRRATPMRQQLAPFPVGQGVSVALQNVDFQASVWVNDAKVVWTSEGEYSPDLAALRLMDEESSPRSSGGQAQPEVWIGASGQPLHVRHVNLYRDTYYTQKTGDGRSGVIRGVTRPQPPDGALALAEPIVQLHRNPDNPRNDEFFVLGDNSPESADSRLWHSQVPQHPGEGYWHLQDRLEEGTYRYGRVPRDHLIGRAFFVYWPAGLQPFSAPVRLVPNVGRMRLIH